MSTAGKVCNYMINRGRKELAGVYVSAVDYDAAVVSILDAAKERRALGVSALAVHGLMTGALDRIHRYRLNALELVVPDGQPVRWALNILYGVQLCDRVYGPNLMLRACEMAAANEFPIFLYGSSKEVLDKLCSKMRLRYPRLQIAGAHPSKFRTLSVDEEKDIIAQISASGARLVFVGLGCPRQETWVFEHLDCLPMPMLAVGAAFDFHAGRLPQAPPWMQKRGLEWLFRLTNEPRRLWRRYLLLNPLFLILVCLQYIGLVQLRAQSGVIPSRQLRYG